jgi:hypothetical protein
MENMQTHCPASDQLRIYRSKRHVAKDLLFKVISNRPRHIRFGSPDDRSFKKEYCNQHGWFIASVTDTKFYISLGKQKDNVLLVFLPYCWNIYSIISNYGKTKRWVRKMGELLVKIPFNIFQKPYVLSSWSNVPMGSAVGYPVAKSCQNFQGY